MEIKELQEELQKKLDIFKTDIVSKAEFAELSKSIETLRGQIDSLPKNTSDEAIKELKTAMDKLEKGLKTQSDMIKALEIRKNETKTLREAMEDVMKSDDFKKSLEDLKVAKTSTTGEFVVKVQTSNATGQEPNTVLATTEIQSVPEKRNAVLDLFTRIPLGQNKNSIMYNNGTFTDNSGYVEEMAEMTSANAATLAAKTRRVAKIGAFMPFSSELLEDMDYFVNWAITKGVNSIQSKVDTELLTGNGNDTTAPTHIYGILSSGSTAFDATKSGTAETVEKAQLYDLIRAMKVQTEMQTEDSYMPTVVLMSPVNFYKLQSLKDTSGKYITILPDGSMNVAGLRVVKTTKLTNAQLLVADERTLQLYDKRVVSIEFERNPKTDSYTMYLYWRGQSLVTDVDKLANIYVADIDTAIAAITKAEAAAAE